MHGQNAIILTTGLLESIHCTYFMLSIGEMEKLGSDMPDALGFGESNP